MVHPMDLSPRKKKPSTTRRAFTIHMNIPTFHSGNKVARIIERPEVPPKAKWFGVLKMEIPTAVNIRPRLRIRKKIRLSFVKIFFFIEQILSLVPLQSFRL